MYALVEEKAVSEKWRLEVEQ